MLPSPVQISISCSPSLYSLSWIVTFFSLCYPFSVQTCFNGIPQRCPFHLYYHKITSPLQAAHVAAIIFQFPTLPQGSLPPGPPFPSHLLHTLSHPFLITTFTCSCMSCLSLRMDMDIIIRYNNNRGHVYWFTTCKGFADSLGAALLRRYTIGTDVLAVCRCC